jgi:holo-[acyl-carrier protein] synthase
VDKEMPILSQHSTSSDKKIRVGNDIVSVERMAHSIEKESFIAKVFHPTEIEYCSRKIKPAASYAARFAAKEAFFKALGTGLYTQGMGPQDVWIENESHGRPALRLSPQAEALLNTLGQAPQWDVSLSHDAQLALATVVIQFS